MIWNSECSYYDNACWIPHLCGQFNACLAHLNLGYCVGFHDHISEWHGFLLCSICVLSTTLVMQNLRLDMV